MKLKLKHPITTATGEVAELIFRDPTAEDYFYQDEFGYHLQMQVLIASLTGHDSAVIKALRGPDYQAAMTKASALMRSAEMAAQSRPVPEGLTLDLAHPIPVGDSGRTISRLTFRAYTTAEDYRAFDLPGGINQTLFLISSLAGSDIALVKKLRAEDYLTAVKKVDALLEADSSFEKPVRPEAKETDPKKPD